jgi:protein-L-isoaspartate(D-aspartate) O-methyltransferase
MKVTINLFLVPPLASAAFFPLPPNFTPPIMPQTTTVLLSTQSSPGQVRLVEKLRREGVVQQKQVIEVMNRVDRSNYIDFDPYWDSPQGIECGQTISAPHMHGFALEEMLPALLNSPRESLKMLDVGCGSGYLTAAMARWVQPHKNEPTILGKPGKVYGMDIYKRLVDLTRANIMKQDADLIESGTVELKHGNGWEGWPEAGPYDAIHVGAAADGFPTTLANQLAVGGVMVIPIGPNGGVQYFYRVERVAETGNADKDFKSTRLMGVRYVPLINPK